jgi:hypothetical protein
MRSSSRVFAFIVAAVGTTSLVAQQTLIQSQGQVIYYSGSSLGLTDGDLAPGMPAGERFGGGAQDNAVIAENGNVLFRAQMLSNAGTALSPAYLQRAYFYGDSKGSLVSLLRGGDPEPSGTIPNAILSTSSSGNAFTGSPRISATGQIMFGASIWDFVGSTVTSTNDTVLYVGTPGNWQILAREGDAAPGCGGALYTALFAGMSQQPTCINSAGYVLFQSSLGAPAVTANNSAWFTGLPGNVQLMLRKGDLAPGLEQVSALGSLSQMNGSGQVITDVTFLTGSGTTPVTNAIDRAVWIYTPGLGIQQLVREGDACTAIPGTNIGNSSNTWGVGTGSTSFNDNTQFLLNTNLAGAVTPNVDDRAMLILAPGSQTLVWRRGDLAPGAQVATPGATIDAANDASCCLNNAGRVAFQGYLIGGGTVAGNDTAIWTGTPGNLAMIVREGDVAPGTGGLLFGQTVSNFMVMNGAGQILFQNTLSDAATSFWAWDPVLGLQCLHRGNMPVEVQPGVFKTPVSTGGVQFTNGDSRPLMFANDGSVVIKLSMNDGTSYGSQAMFKVRIGSLTGIPGKISEAAGGTHSLYLNAGAANAGLVYVVAGSASGTNPGTPIGGLVVPLNIDGYTDFTLQNANVAPFVATFGVLNADGRALAQIVIPPATPGIAGVVVHHAYGVLDAFNNLVFASEAARLEITP